MLLLQHQRRGWEGVPLQQLQTHTQLRRLRQMVCHRFQQVEQMHHNQQQKHQGQQQEFRSLTGQGSWVGRCKAAELCQASKACRAGTHGACLLA